MAELLLVDRDGYCVKCEQDASSGVHFEMCPGVRQVRLFYTARRELIQLSFKEWKRRVDSSVQRIAGVGVDDLGDADFWCAWDSSTPPGEFAVELLEENGFPFGEDE